MKTFCIHIPRDFTDSSVMSEGSSARFLDELLSGMVKTLKDDDKFSLEIFCTKQIIYITFIADEIVANLLKGVIYTILPTSEVKQIPDYLAEIDEEECCIAVTDVHLSRQDIFPVKNYSECSFSSIAMILNSFSTALPDDNVMMQIVCRPFNPTSRYLRAVKAKIKRDRILRMCTTLKYWVNDKPYDDYVKSSVNKSFELKHFSVNIKVASFCKRSMGTQDVLEKRLTNNVLSVVGALKCFDSAFNKYVTSDVSFREEDLIKLQSRDFSRQPFILSVKEVVTLWQVPTLKDIANTPTVLSVKAGPPKNLPIDIKDRNISFFAKTDYRDTQINFGIHREDRRRHLYLVGKSGVGKSSLMKLLAKSDIVNGAGICVLDPHGDLIDNLLPIIPKSRIEDVVIFDPTDVEFPVTFNPFSDVSPDYRLQFALSFIEVFKKVFSSIWHDRLEHLLRYTLFAVFEAPNESFLSIRKILTDKQYRLNLVRGISDSAVKNFWTNEYDEWSERFYDDAVAPLLDKIDAFTASEYLRNIFLQTDNKFNFRDIIDNNKILLIKIPKGILGDENASLLGSILVFKIYHAAMSRADIPEDKRKDFYFYVDEIQSFVTASFKQILSEARKYRLNLTMANQYLGQLPPDVVETIFGNIASMIVFTTGADDALKLSYELAPTFSQSDIMNLSPRSIYVKMTINGKEQPPFSARTLDVPSTKEQNHQKECISYSRARYAIKREDVKDIYEFRSNIDDSEIQSLKLSPTNFYENNNIVYLAQFLRCYGTVLLLSYLDIFNNMLSELKQDIFRKVEEIDLKGTTISDVDLKNFEYLPNLIELNLDGTNVTSRGMKYLSKLSGLELLSLNDTDIDDRAISMISTMPLITLSLRNTNITNDSIQYFYKMDELEELDIRGTQIDEVGISSLKGLNPNLIIIA